MRSHALAWGMLALVSGCASSPATRRDGLTAGPAQSRELTATIERLDRELFAAVFDRCDPVRVREPISRDGSRLAAWVIPTDEELLIARDSVRVVQGAAP